jgi:predicted ester cyclase
MRPRQRPWVPNTDSDARKALVRCAVEAAVNGGDLSVLDELLAPEVRGVMPGVSGPDDLKELLGVYREAVSDAHWSIQGQVADGNMVVTDFMATGTQTGALWGLPATGRRMAVAGVLFSRCQDGRIIEQRIEFDRLGLLQQLGVMPELSLTQEVLVARMARAPERAAGKAISAPDMT